MTIRRAMRANIDILAQDLRYAARGFVRSPTFTLAALFAIALGTGAGTAVFSVVDRILFRSLPYPQADRLVSVGFVAPIIPQEFMLGADYVEWRARQQPFESIASWSGINDCDLTGANPVRLACAQVEASFLPTLGVQPMAGRNFTRDEDRPNAPPVALLSYGLWQSRFGGDRNVVGKTFPLEGQSATILGVLPPDFEMPTLEHADVLAPQALDEAQQHRPNTGRPLWSIARLKSGVTPAQAAAALQPLFQESLQYVPGPFRKEVSLRVRALRDRQIHDARLASWILLGAVLAVLLIACANVANLLLARAATRQRELAVRLALGANRRRLVRQTLTESLLLAVAGGVAGCLLAAALLRIFVAIAPEGIPRLQQATVDWRVLLFTLAVSLTCGIVFGLAPALEHPRPETLAGWRSLGGRHYLFRHSLVAAQICASLVLLTGASLLMRSLWNLQNQPLGMRTGSVLTATVALGQKSYADPGSQLAFFEELERRLHRIPGLTQLALSDSTPLSGTARSTIYSVIDVAGRPRAAEGTGGMAIWRAVTPGYFAALGIPILRGRGFREQDRDPHQNAVILSDSLARRMFPGEDPLGKQIKPGRSGPWKTVIGVAGNVKNGALAQPDDPEFYVVRQHAPEPFGRTAIAILSGPIDPAALARWVRAEVAALDPTLPVNIETLDQRVGRLAQRPRFNAWLLGLFAAMGLLLSAIGLYGVISFQVAQRTQEIGVRMALGATPGAVARLVLGHAARWTLAGAGFGVIGSWFGARFLGAMLFHVSPRDPWILAAAAAALWATAMLAAWVPSRRAARLDPMQALRQD
ncbi:MAG TPA: ABC transporter permease [Bryobacteraceae bacterium]|nr:ABC transporter permease [Bryobacteraceae bacterium]